MPSRRAALEAAIDADPDDVRAYAVFADYLQDLGDPRGELLALAIAAETDRALTVAERDFLDAHHQDLLPAAYTANVAALWAWLGNSVWRWGMFQTLSVGPGCEEVLAAVLDHPSGRFVVELVLEHGLALPAAVAAIAAAPRRAVRRLSIGIRSPLGPRDDTELAELWQIAPAILPNVTCLRLGAAYADGARRAEVLVALDLFPALRELHLVDSTGTAELVELLARSTCVRRLTRLSLAGGDLDDARDVLGRAFAHLALDVTRNHLSGEHQRMLLQRAGIEVVPQRWRATPNVYDEDTDEAADDD